MKRIITAIGNQILNNELKKENDIELINNDIQYKEAIIDLLKKNNDVDIIVISEKLPGDIDNKYLVEKIKQINNKINIIYILEKENVELKKILEEKNINDIYYNNKNKLSELVDIIKNKEIYKEEEMKKEIEMLKNIILNNNINKKIEEEKNNNNDNDNTKSKINKIISIAGCAGVGKSIICSTFAYLIKNKKVLIIDSDYYNQDIHTIFGSKIYSLENYIVKINNKIDVFTITEENIKYIENKIATMLEKFKNEYNLILIDVNSDNKYNINKIILKNSDKIFFLIESNFISIKRSRKLIFDYINLYNIENNKIEIIINKFKNNNIEIKILKNIFSEFNITGKIKLNSNYNNLINKNFKICKIDTSIKKDILNILYKIDKKSKLVKETKYGIRKKYRNK